MLFLYSVRGIYVLFFFFFQAEDGIRDVAVTGVQTCALPISRVEPAVGLGSRGERDRASPRGRRSGRRDPTPAPPRSRLTTHASPRTVLGLPRAERLGARPSPGRAPGLRRSLPAPA